MLWNGTDIKHDPDKLSTVLDYLPQDFGIYPDLSAAEFLAYLAAVKGLEASSARKRIGKPLEVANLADAARRPLGGFSGGMRQRVGTAQALLNDPQLLIVDEPTADLDPEERVRFCNLLSELSGERIVILSMHIVSDAEAVVTDIVLIAQGQLVLRGVPEELLAGVSGKVWEVVVSSEELPAHRQRHLVSNAAYRSEGVHGRVVAEVASTPGARPLELSLEDAYLAALAAHRKHAAAEGTV